MEAQFDKARPEDYEEVMDLGNYVFSHAHSPHDFPALLPKLYRREYFMDGIHYLAREGGRIRAVIGAYPLEMEFPGSPLPGRGIGMVSVHPYCRSRGYMKVLMETALEDMRREGMVFSCLGGRRQRYEYFGYTPVGTAYTFTCNGANVQHTLGRSWNTGLSLSPVDSGSEALLDSIQALHLSKIARVQRRRDRLFDILSSWNARILAVNEGGRFEGYIIHSGGGGTGKIIEINLKNPSRMIEAVGLFLRRQQEAGLQDFVQISAGPHEGEKINFLSRFAEEYRQGPAYSFAVFDYPRFVDAFLKLKARLRVLGEGSFTLLIEGGPRLALSVSGGLASAAETEAPPDLSLSGLDALHFLFSPLGHLMFPAIEKSPFLQGLLPLPLFGESVDGV